MLIQDDTRQQPTAGDPPPAQTQPATTSSSSTTTTRRRHPPTASLPLRLPSLSSFSWVLAVLLIVLLSSLPLSVRAQRLEICPYDEGYGEYAFSPKSGKCEKIHLGGDIFPVINATDELFLYGKFEARIKAFQCSGAIVTFFLYKPNSDKPGSQWQELDIEIFGSTAHLWEEGTESGVPNTFQSNLITGITPGRELKEAKHVTDTRLDTEFHTYTMEWTPTRIAWFFDDELVREDTDPDSMKKMNESMTLHINAWVVNPRIEMWAGVFDPDCLPLTAQFDYVKVWDYDNKTDDFTPRWSDTFDEFKEYSKGGRWGIGEYTFDFNRVQYEKSQVTAKNGTLHVVVDRKNLTAEYPPYESIDNSCWELDTAINDFTLGIEELDKITVPLFEKANTSDACQAACQAEWRCRHFTFTEGYGCELKWNRTQDSVKIAEGATTGPKYCVEWCIEELEDGTDVNQYYQLENLKAKSRKACADTCLETTLCGGYVYHPKSHNCQMKGFPSVPKNVSDESPHFQGGVKIACGYPATTPPPEEISCYSMPADYKGLDVGGKAKGVKTASECQALCQENKQCFNVVYGEQWGGCYLKGWEVELDKKTTGLIAGPRSCDLDCVEEGFIYHSNDTLGLMDTPSDAHKSPDTCAMACEDTAECSIFTWRGPQCHLFGKEDDKTPLHIIKGTPDKGDKSLKAAKKECESVCKDDTSCHSSRILEAQCMLMPHEENKPVVKVPVYGYYHDAFVPYVSGPAACPSRASKDLINDLVAAGMQNLTVAQRKRNTNTPDKCPDGYIRGTNGVCYRLSFERATWEEAEAICEGEKAHLATPTTAEDQASILELFCLDDGMCLVPRDGLHDGDYFIGLRRTNKGKWRWIDGEKVTFSNWAGKRKTPLLDYGQGVALKMPADDKGKKCAYIYPQDYSTGKINGGWGSIECHTSATADFRPKRVTRRYICEYDPSFKPPPHEKKPKEGKKKPVTNTTCPCCSDGDMDGSDVGGLASGVESIAECQKMCDQTADCFYVVFGRQWGGCYLKGWDAVPADTTTGSNKKKERTDLVHAPRSCEMSCSAQGFTLPLGGDDIIKTEPAHSPSVCATRCKQIKGCEKYLWRGSRCLLQQLMTNSSSPSPIFEMAALDAATCNTLCMDDPQCTAGGEYHPPSCTYSSDKSALFTPIHPYYHESIVPSAVGPAPCPSRNSTAALAHVQVQGGGKCPDGYQMGSNGVCYRLSFERASWKEAEGICEQEFGHLATINDEAEHKAIMGLFCSSSGGNSSTTTSPHCWVPQEGHHDSQVFVGLKMTSNGWHWLDDIAEKGKKAGDHKLIWGKNLGDDLSGECGFIAPQDPSTGALVGSYGTLACHRACVPQPAHFPSPSHVDKWINLPSCLTPDNKHGKIVRVTRRYVCEAHPKYDAKSMQKEIDIAEPAEIGEPATDEVKCAWPRVDLDSKTIAGGRGDGVKSLADCQDICGDVIGCHYVVFEPDKGACHLKGWEVGRIRTDERLISAPRSCDMSCTDTGYEYGVGDGSAIKTIKLQHLDRSDAKAQERSVDECREACKNEEACRFFTWMQPACQLIGRPEEDAKSGLSTLHLIGASSQSECNIICETDPACRQTTFQPPTCTLKSQNALTQRHAPLFTQSVVTYMSGPAPCPSRQSDFDSDPRMREDGGVVGDGCPEGYYRGGDRGGCYKVHLERLSWDEAEHVCMDEGGHLASIGNADEDSAFLQLFCSDEKASSCLLPRGARHDGEYYIGAKNDPASCEGASCWSWSDGTTWKYTHWGGNRGHPELKYRKLAKINPDTEPKEKECAFFYPQDADGKPNGGWGARQCESHRRFVCEKREIRGKSGLEELKGRTGPLLAVKLLHQNYDAVMMSVSKLQALVGKLKAAIAADLHVASDDVHIRQLLSGSIVALFELTESSTVSLVDQWKAILRDPYSHTRRAFAVDPHYPPSLTISPNGKIVPPAFSSSDIPRATYLWLIILLVFGVVMFMTAAVWLVLTVRCKRRMKLVNTDHPRKIHKIVISSDGTRHTTRSHSRTPTRTPAAARTPSRTPRSRRHTDGVSGSGSCSNRSRRRQPSREGPTPKQSILGAVARDAEMDKKPMTATGVPPGGGVGGHPISPSVERQDKVL
ncbi:unnamed protein product [Vitrella brassicaformis CCMP3155]|uniref:GH16 domain-containing protein n=2 Tax=Vitrella brassicaformis TaxID=1169539 RepID=A0A0G4EYN3_VITBC|nr:unnamed protein product [Vitrella brassicaformis CCMP3155]|eukprot:CEM04044.1 unnamed protein product [Vitrella brassicaformis CCMP3155]